VIPVLGFEVTRSEPLSCVSFVSSQFASLVPSQFVLLVFIFVSCDSVLGRFGFPLFSS